MDDKNRNKRALKLLAVAVGVFVIALTVINPLYETWQANSEKVEQLEQTAQKLKQIDKDKTNNEEVLAGFIMPVEHESQLGLFSQSIEKCFKESGVEWNRDPAYVSLRGKKEPTTGLNIYHLKISAVTQFSNIINLLSQLKSSPYLYAIEEFSIKREGNNPQSAKLDLTLSTLAK